MDSKYFKNYENYKQENGTGFATLIQNNEFTDNHKFRMVKIEKKNLNFYKNYNHICLQSYHIDWNYLSIKKYSLRYNTFCKEKKSKFAYN